MEFNSGNILKKKNIYIYTYIYTHVFLGLSAERL